MQSRELSKNLTGSAFYSVRRLHGIRRADFCRWSGVGYHTVYEWEKKQDHPPLYGVRLLEYFIRLKKEAEDVAS